MTCLCRYGIIFAGVLLLLTTLDVKAQIIIQYMGHVDDPGTVPVTPSQPTPPTVELDRGMYVIHGTGGNAEAVAPAERLIADNDGDGERWAEMGETEGYDYDDLIGISQGAAEVRDLIPTRAEQMARGIDPDRSFLIGPSYGGLVARRLLRDIPTDERPFGGIISLATPHEGTQMATNREELFAAGIDLASRMGRGPVAEHLEGVFFISWFNIDKLYQSVSGIIENSAALLFPIIDNGVIVGDQQLSPSLQGIRDMIPGSAELAALPATDNGFPSLHIVCTEEEDDLVWRFMNSLPIEADLEYQGVNITIPNVRELPDFSANTDEPFRTDMINNEAHYLERYTVWRDRHASASVFGDWYGGTHYSRGEMDDLKNAWHDGWEAISNFDDTYKQLAGFFDDTWAQVTTGRGCRCTSGSYSWIISSGNESECVEAGRPDPVSGEPACPGATWASGTTNWEIISRFYRPNDGVVTVESQAAWGTTRMDQVGDDHFTKSNSTAHQITMERILDGSSHPFFRSTR